MDKVIIDTDYLPDCPCLNCVCVPICRHKQYSKLHKNCINLRMFLPGIYNDREDRNYIVFDKKVALKLALQPTTWDVQVDGSIRLEKSHGYK